MVSRLLSIGDIASPGNDTIADIDMMATTTISSMLPLPVAIFIVQQSFIVAPINLYANSVMIMVTPYCATYATPLPMCVVLPTKS